MSQEQEPQVIAPAAFTPRAEDDGKPKWRARPLQIGIALVLLVFAVSLWFLFTARSVLFTFEPEYAELDIDGGLQLKLADRYLLRSGDYRLTVEAQGHYPIEQDLTVTDDDSQEVNLVLKRLPEEA